MERTRILLLLFTSVIILFKLCFFPPNQTHEDLERATLGKERAWPLLYASDVMALDGKNFSDFMIKNRYVAVMFYADWCYWSQKLAPEFAAAAKMLKGEAELVMVDAWQEQELAKKHDIQGYPTLDLFVGGARKFRFYGERTRDVLSAWVREKMAPGAYSITTMDEAELILSAESKLVLGFLDYLEGEESEEFFAAAKLHSDINFYQTTSAEVAELFHIHPKCRRPALIFLHLGAGTSALFDDKFTRSAIANFVTNIMHPLVLTLSKQNAESIFQHPMKQLWLFAPPYGSEKLKSAFEEVAKTFKGKLLHVYVGINFEGVGKRVFQEFGVSGNAPRVIAYSTHHAKKYVLDGELGFSSIKSFGEDFLEHKLTGQSDRIVDSKVKLPSHSRPSNQLRSSE